MGVLASMVGNAFRTSKNIMFVLVLLVSLMVNVASFTVNTISMAISAAIEAVTGVETVVSTVRKQKVTLASTAEAACTWEGRAIGKGLALEKTQAELSATRQLAAKWEGKAIGTGLRLERETAAKGLLEAEAAESRSARRVAYEGIDMTMPEAVTKAAGKIKTRTAKLAFTDLTATGAQALPWIGAAAVVAVTGYDIAMSCDTMKDMRAIEVAVNPAAADDPDVDRVCGMKVPTEEEVWTAIKASPGAVWDALASVLDGLPSMSDVTGGK